METLWLDPERNRGFTVREMLAQFDGQPAYTTLMTTLDRLFKKGLLARCLRGRAFVYSTKVTKDNFLREMARDMVTRFVGTQTDEALLSSFVDVVSQRDHDLLNELEHLVKTKRRQLRKE